jgi:DNA-binding NtrC family response regulator
VSSSYSVSNATPRTTILLVEDDPFQANAHRSALEHDFASIERVADASDALIRVDDPGFQETLALVVVGLRLPGMAGPGFVSELKARLREVPIVVIGRHRETAVDYSRENVEFLPAGSLGSELAAVVRKILSKRLRRVA